jgi:hypothetical protein
VHRAGGELIEAQVTGQHRAFIVAEFGSGPADIDAATVGASELTGPACMVAPHISQEGVTAVVLPAIRGQVQTGIRVALGIAWVVLVPAEMLGVRSGLGYQVLNARDQLAYDQVVAVIVVIGALGFVLDLAARWLVSLRERSANAG